MEYGENDFGSQNPQLNSEEVSKSSPGLSAYSLPKYDFDDSLQGDMRFDSLVETETFLGIESQEDTSWIDDFSRGSRIEFSSQDAEPASISRGNNVWSEATSLESVEMLLKSVGQDDVIRGETEVQDCSTVHELGSSGVQLTPYEEDGDCLSVENANSGLALPVDQHIHKLQDDEALTQYPEEDSGRLCTSGNNGDSVVQEIDDETAQCHVTKDTQAISKDDNPSVDTKPKLSPIKAASPIESEIQGYVQAPVPHDESQVKCLHTADDAKVAESMHSGLDQGNGNGNPLNQNIQVTGSQVYTEDQINVSAEGADDMLLEKEFKSEEHSAKNILENVVSPGYLSTMSGGEPDTIETGNNHLKEPYASNTEELHNISSAETCPMEIVTSSPAEEVKCETEKNIDRNAHEGPNVNLEGESAFMANSAEATNLNSNASSEEKILSDALVTGGAGVQNNAELCVGTGLNENREESLKDDDEISASGVEEDEFGGGYEQMVDTVAIKEPVKSLTGNDVLGIQSSKMDIELAEESSSACKVISTEVLESVAQATADSSVCIIPPVSDDHIAKVSNISVSTIIGGDTMETTASVGIIDGNDKCLDSTISLQSNSKATSVEEKICGTAGLLVNDTRVASPVESACHIQIEGTPFNSPSAIPAANGKDNEDPDISPPVVSCGSESKCAPETEKRIQCQSDKIGTSCTNDGSVGRDPKASDAPDNDKTFSFIITSSAEQSETETIKLWQPFTSQVPLSSQNVNDSPATPGVEQISLGNQEIQQNTDGQVAPGSKGASVRKPRRASGKTTMESGKKESRQKLTTPSKLKDSNIFSTVGTGSPDSNIASSRPTAHLRQFTDLQQLQLRAQIFVYGSLIQGTAPDEACLVAAFGGPDGGRSVWGNARQQCLERIQGQKSQEGNLETPTQQHSSAKTANQKVKISKSQTKCTSITRKSATNTISHLTTPASPLWTLHTPGRLHFGGTPSKTFMEHNAHSQSYPQSSSPMPSTVVHTSTWPPHSAPWMASPSPQVAASKASPEACPSLLMRSKMEPVILTPVGGSSISETNVRHSSPGPIALPVGLNNAIIGAPSLEIDDRTLPLKPGLTVSNTKPSKRKKVELSEALMVTEPHLNFEAASAACVSSILPTTVPTPISESKVKTSGSAHTTVIASSDDHAQKSSINADDIGHKVDEAKLHAEDAAAYSAAAVDLSQKMWSQLARQKDSGLAPDVQTKIASAALAIEAAVAVAKAAAAAAKVASDAAVQAKLMADEVMDSSRISLIDSATEISLNSSISSLGNAMLGETEKNSGALLAANEKAESASVALKQTRNLNAIMKAAELAAQAVTQAGKVAVMGSPLPLSELANAGPDGCWKLTIGREPHSGIANYCHEVNAIEGAANAFSSARETVEVCNKTSNDCYLDNIHGDGSQVTIMDIGNNDGKPLGTTADGIKEGSAVEIYKEGDGIKAAWYSANVLELKNGEAYVCYTEKLPTESSGDYKEWIKLDIHGDDAPKIRTAHPMTAMPTEGTRKRRREAMGKSFWLVGDRVDAWRQNCWWEGVITEKSSKDDTAFTVHFSAQGETSVIKACHLRPSMIWQDGKWVEWSSSMSNDGDTRQEKRMKLCDPKHEVGVNEKATENVDPTVAKIQEDSRLLDLSDNEKKFNVGKSNKDVKRPVTQRTARPGLQNEGKTVSFGVPKPGKKRKFMDVSQHYVARNSKTTDNNDSTKSGKMLIPKGSGLPGWKNSTRIDLPEKKGPATQPQLPNSRKPASTRDQTLDKKNVSGSVSHNNNAIRSQGTSGFAAFSTIGRTRNSPFEFTSTSNEKSSKKLLTSTSSKSELSSKTKFEPPSQKLGKIEENKVYNSTAGTSNSEGLEPRRSNRRIQPTSRLLEGLQTSLSIPKQPSVTHDKGLKGHNRSASSRGNQ